MQDSGGSKVLLVSLDNVRYDCVSYAKEKPHLKQFYAQNLVDTPTSKIKPDAIPSSLHYANLVGIISALVGRMQTKLALPRNHSLPFKIFISLCLRPLCRQPEGLHTLPLFFPILVSNWHEFCLIQL